MQQFTVALEESKVAIIAEAQRDTGEPMQKWFDDHIAAALKAQRAANLTKAIRKNAKNAATLVRYGHLTLDKAIMQIGFADQVEEFGGIGKLYKLILTLGNDYFVPAEKIRAQVVAVPAPVESLALAEGEDANA